MIYFKSEYTLVSDLNRNMVLKIKYNSFLFAPILLMSTMYSARKIEFFGHLLQFCRGGIVQNVYVIVILENQGV